MSFWQAIFIGFLQGATELFPVSSLGHAVLVPKLLGWDIHQADASFVPYLTLLHLGTASALLLIFREDWGRMIGAFLGAVYRGRLDGDPHARMAALILAGTVPTAALGAFFESDFKRFFASPRFAAAFLCLNAGIMGAGELLRRQAERRAPSSEQHEAAFGSEKDLGFGAAIVVGAAQSLALLPGISRSGATITGGLVAGLRHESAARFSFLLATPIILAAGVLEVPSLFTTPGIPIATYLLAAVVAGVTAYLSTRFLMRYFRSGRLDPFAAYCLALGVLGLVLVR